jgi:glutaredoxin 3
MATVRIYTRRGCGYCDAAIELLHDKGIAFDEIDATGDATLRRWLAGVTGRTTVPQIFIDGTPIGGYTDLAALDRRGELDRMLGQGSSGSTASTSG